MTKEYKKLLNSIAIESLFNPGGTLDTRSIEAMFCSSPVFTPGKHTIKIGTKKYTYKKDLFNMIFDAYTLYFAIKESDNKVITWNASQVINSRWGTK